MSPASLPEQSFFVGRATELAFLAQSPATVSLIAGPAGIGKTALAIRVALAIGPFPGGVVFADLRERPTSAGLMRDLGPLVSGRERALFVLDDVADTSQIDSLLRDNRSHHFIVTTGQSDGVPGARSVTLDVPPAADAIALLAGFLGDNRIAAAPKAAGAVAELCGRLPVAIRLAAGLLADEPQRSLHDVASLLLDGGSVFDVARRRLSGHENAVLLACALVPGGHTRADALAAAAGLPVTDTRLALDRLCRAGLVDAGGQRMPDLVRRNAIEHATGPTATLDRLFAHALTVVDDATGHLGTAPVHAKASRFVARTDSLAWLDTEYPGLLALVRDAYLTGRHADTVDLVTALHELFNIRRYWRDWTVAGRLAVSCARQLGDRRREATALTGLGDACRCAGAWDRAVECYRDALAITRSLGLRRDEAVALNNLGLAYRYLGEWDDAIDQLTAAQSIFREIGDRHSEAGALDNLGLLHARLGSLREGVEHSTAALNVFRALGDRRGVAMALNNIGNMYRQADQAVDVTPLHEEALAIFRALRDRHGEAVTSNSLGNALLSGGQADAAVDRFERTVELYRGIGDRDGLATALTNLGRAYRKLGDAARVVACWSEALRVFDELPGADVANYADLLRAELDRFLANDT